MRKAITAITLAAALAITTAAVAVPLSAQTNTLWTAPAPAPGEVRCLEYQNTKTEVVVSNRDGGGVYVSGDGIELTDIGIRNWLAACNAAAKAVGSNQRYVRCADGSFEADLRTYGGGGNVINTDYADCEHYVIPTPQPDEEEMTALERCIEYAGGDNAEPATPEAADNSEYTRLQTNREACEELLA